MSVVGRIVRGVVCAVIAIPLSTAPAAADDRAVSFRAVWVDAFSPGFKSTSEISALVSRAVTGRYNAIIAEVLAYHDRGTGGHGAYWNSTIVPKATDISGGIDPLAALVQQGHASGLEVHAWIVPFRTCTTWPPNGNSRVSQHPEYLMVPLENMGGGPAPVNGAYTLDPGSPDVQEYLIGIVRELVTNYQIDGVNWDYIRYTTTNAGYPASNSYTQSSLARFRALTGYVGTPPVNETGWNNFRRRTINELVRRARAEIPAITSNPRQPLRHTADLICFGNAPGDFTASSAYTLFQNWEYWMDRGWLDAGIPMNYKREYEADEALWYRNWVNAAIGWRHARHMFCGQGNYLNRKADSVTQMQYALNAGADGTTNYSYYETADENMNGTPETDWTWYTYVANNLFTSTASPPTMPWRSAATATEGTLWGRVTDPATGNPIDGASIQVGTLDPVDSDGNGYYVVTLVPAAAGGTTYTVTVTKNGCPAVQIPGVKVQRAGLKWLDVHLCNSAPAPGDYDGDGDVDLNDLAYFDYCMVGPDYGYMAGHFCLDGDADADRDVDLADFSAFQWNFTGPH